MTAPWPEQAEPPAQVYRCRHCPKDIMWRAGYWIDQDGIMVCVKRRLDASGTWQDPVLHEPLPVIGESS